MTAFLLASTPLDWDRRVVAQKNDQLWEGKTIVRWLIIAPQERMLIRFHSP